jgi:hypothetical protein
MAIQFFSQNTTTTSQTLTGAFFTNPVSARSTICLFCQAASFAAITPFSASDSLNGTYNTVVTQSGGDGSAMAMLYIENAIAGSPVFTITIPNPSYFGPFCVFGMELPPTSGLRTSNSDAVAFSGLNASMPFVGTSLNDICAAAGYGNGGSDAATAGDFGSNPATADGGLAAISGLSQDGLSSGGTINATMTVGTTGHGWVMVGGVFIPATVLSPDPIFYGMNS